MIKRGQLSPGGPEVSELVFGFWRMHEDPSSHSPEKVLEKVDACLELGITTMDHAAIYGLFDNEELFGKALAERPSVRDDIEIVTKAGIYIPCDNYPEVTGAHYNATADKLIESCERSLKMLQTDRIDLFLVHRPDWLCRADDTAAGLEKLREQGKILHAGVSNYTPPQFDLLAAKLGRPPATNQVEINLLTMDALYDGTLNQCEQHNVRPMAWSPLGGGRLFDADDEAAARIRAKMDELSPKYGDAKYDALAIAWVLAHPSRPVGILGTNKIRRIQSAAKAATIKLKHEDWYALWTASKGHSIP